LPDVVEDGRSGVLVAPEDPAALADAIVAVAADGDRRSELGRRASELARQFDSRVPVRRLEAVYEEVSR
jgi:glycosyltransferase involved in cell wall biosynthesis